MATRTLTGFHPYGSNYFNISNGDDIAATNFHFQSNQIPLADQDPGDSHAVGAGAAFMMRQNPDGFILGTNAYIETYIPDGLDWSYYYTDPPVGLGLNQCAYQVRMGSTLGCPRSDISGVVVDGGWDGCKTPDSPFTKYHHCAFFRLRDDIVEYDSGLKNFGDSYDWEDNLVVGFYSGISTRPGKGGVSAGGHIINVRRSVFVSNRILTHGNWSGNKLRKTISSGVTHNFTDCVIAYDHVPTVGGDMAVVGSGDTATNSTFVWLGSGTVPAAFNVGGAGFTVVQGTGAVNHRGVTGATPRDWLENYMVWWLNQSGERFTNLRNTIKSKVDWSRVRSGTDRHIMFPNMNAKLAGTTPPPPSEPPYTGPNWYVDSAYAGAEKLGSFEQPFSSLADITSRTFSPGDKILLKRGSIFRPGTPVLLKGSGSAGNPILLGNYGDGSLPRAQIIGSPSLDGAGSWTHAASGRWTAAVTSDTTPTTLWLNDLNEGAPNVATTALVESGTPGTWAWIGGTLHLQSGGTEINPTSAWTSIRLNRLSVAIEVQGSYWTLEVFDVHNCHRGVRTGLASNPTQTNTILSTLSVARCSLSGILIETTSSQIFNVDSSFHDQRPGGLGVAAHGVELGRNSGNCSIINLRSRKIGGDCIRQGANSASGMVVDGCTLGGPGADSPYGSAVRTQAGGGTIRNSVLRNGRDPGVATLWHTVAPVTVEDCQIIHDGAWACNRPETGSVLTSRRNRWWSTSLTGTGSFALWAGESGQGATINSEYDIMISDAVSATFAAPAGCYYNNVLNISHGTLVSRGAGVGFRRRNTPGVFSIVDSIIYAATAVPLELLFSFGTPGTNYVAPNINRVLLYRADGQAQYVNGDAGFVSAPTAAGVPDRNEAHFESGEVFTADGYAQTNWTANPLFLSVSGGDFRLQGTSPALNVAGDGTHLGADQTAVADPVGPGEPVPILSGTRNVMGVEPRVYFKPTLNFGAGPIPVQNAVSNFLLLSPALGGRPVGYTIEHDTLDEWEHGRGIYDEGTGTISRTAANVWASSGGIEPGENETGAGVLTTFSAGTKSVVIQPDSEFFSRAMAMIPGAHIAAGDTDYVYADGDGGNIAVAWGGSSNPLTAPRTATFPAARGLAGAVVWLRNPPGSGHNITVRIEIPTALTTYSTKTLIPGLSKRVRKDVDGLGWWSDFGPDLGGTLAADLDGGARRIFGHRNLLERRSTAQTLSTANFKDGSVIEHTGGNVTYTIPARVTSSQTTEQSELRVEHWGNAGTAITWNASGVTLRGTTGTLAVGHTATLIWSHNGTTAFCQIRQTGA